MFSSGREPANSKARKDLLSLGVEWVYPFTQAHKLSFQGYLYYLEGLLVPGDSPEELMKGVIERGEGQDREMAEAERGDRPNRKGERAGKSGRKRKARGPTK